ncbi:MAG: thiol-disulfide oxidoreductase, partial [Candidatus Rokuibacteriota bacterium]
MADDIEDWFERGVTDGLPVVPPTRERVERMLSVMSRPRDMLVAEVPPNYGRATVEKLAVNAVMAGCHREYFPVVLAVVEAACDPAFNLHGQSGTTNAASPLIIVNGPARRRLHINCGAGVFGPGSRANATIGRALRLVMINLGGTRAGEISMSTFGHPGRYTYCIGEHEEVSPWEPLHVERGHRREESTV